MIKTLLFVLLSFFHVFLPDTQAVVENPDSIPPRPALEYMFRQPADSTEFPPLYLLQTALAGYELLIEEKSINRGEVITIIDFSLQSDKERLWVLDLHQGKVLFHCLVSHGRNSGELMAENFSNTPGSYESSPGFYVTGETYIGKNGLSLALDGLETGINDKARQRAIVMHGADYVSDDFVRAHGRLGRSQGCPAVPVELSEEIIKTIKGGSCLFIYAPTPNYTSNSHIIRKIHPATKT
jgi:hypothetical protein